MAADPGVVAPGGAPNIHVFPGLYLLRLDLPYVDPPAPDEDAGPRWLERALGRMEAAPVEGAWLLIVPPAVASGLPPWIGRTNAAGAILPATADELEGQSVTGAAAPWRFLEPGVEYRIFWTDSAAVARAVLAEHARDPGGTEAWHGFFPFRFAPSQLFDDNPGRHFGLPLDLDTRLGLLLEGLEADVPAGYVSKSMLDDAGLHHARFLAGRRYLLARRPALDAIRVAELAVGGYLEVRRRGFANHTVFATAQRAADDARQGRRFAPDAAEADRNQHAGVYLEYAYKCAHAGVDRSLFARATRIVLLNEAAWREPAAEILRLHKIPHPSEGPADFKYVNARLVLDHFDFYTFGLRHPTERPWRSRVGHVDKLLAHQAAAVRRKVRALVERFAPWAAVCRDIGARCPGSPDERDGLHLRCLAMLTALDISYPDTLDPDDPRLQAYIGWMATTLDKLGGSVDFALNTYPQIQAAQHAKVATAAARESFGKLATKILRLARKSGAPLVERPLRAGSAIRVDFEAGVATVLGPDGKKVGSFEVFTRTSDPDGRALWKTNKKMRVSAGAPIPEMVEEKQVPKVVSAAGSALGLALSIASFSADLEQKDGTLVVGRVAQNAVQTIDSLPAALRFLKLGKGAEGVEWVARKIGARGVGPGVEAVLNLREGQMVLLDATGTADTFMATTMGVKGLALIGSGAVGATATALGTAGAVASALEMSGGAATYLAAVSGPMFAVAGLAVALGALTVLACDILVYGHGGSAGALGPLEDAIASATKDEFGVDLLKGTGGDPTRYTISRTHDAGEHYLADLGRALATL
jgi:hypothetical protein